MPSRQMNIAVDDVPIGTQANPMNVTGIGGGGVTAEYNATPPTVTDGATTPLQTNQYGDLNVVPVTQPSYEQVANARAGVGPVASADDFTPLVLQSVQTGTSNGTQITMKGYNQLTLAVTVGSNVTGTITFEGTIDDTNWFPCPVEVLATPGTYITTITNPTATAASVAVGYHLASRVPLSMFRARTAITVGNATVKAGRAV